MKNKMAIAVASMLSIGGFLASPAGAQTQEGYPKVQAKWEQVGWGGGSFYWSTSWHPTDENVIYMGSDCAGAYRSDDKGLHWKFTNNGISGYEVLCMAVSPAAPDMIWAMTSEGLCKSTDRANTWEIIPASGAKELNITCAKRSTIRSIAIDPKNADIVYAGSKTGKVFKTEDGGKTWKELPYRDVLPKEADSPAFIGNGAMYMVYDPNGGGNDPMGRMSKFYGNDKAQDWSTYKKFSAQVKVPDDAPAIEASLVVQSGDKWLWQQGAWIECKPGSWVEIPLDLSTLKDMNSVRMIHLVIRTFQQGWKGNVMVDAIALHTDPAGKMTAGQVPDGKDTVLVSDWEKKGDTEGWTANRQTKDSLKVTAIRQSQEPQEKKSGDGACGIAISPKNPSLVFIANTKHGVFRSQDAGATWKVLDTPKTAYGVTVSLADDKIIWAACGDNGVYRSADSGNIWTAMNEGILKKISIIEIVLHPANPSLAYAIGNNGWSGYFFRSDDEGKKWVTNRKVQKRPDNRLPSPEVAGDKDGDTSSLTNLAVNPKNSDELFISANWTNVFSKDGGKTFECRQDEADNTCSTDIQFFGGKVYVTAMDEGLLVSENNGGEWRQLIPMKYDPNISGHFWRVRLSKAGDSTHIVTTCSPWVSFGNPKCMNRVFISDDDGKTFKMTTSGLPDYVPNVNCMWGRSFPRSLAMDPKNPNVLYLGMDGNPEPEKKLPGGGIFRSADGGLTWTRCASQPGGLRLYYGLVVDPTDSKRIYFSSCGEGGGAWKSNDEGATWEHMFKDETWSFNLDVSPTGVVYVGSNNFWRSDDQGKTWKKLTDSKDGSTVVGIAIDPTNEQRIWISRTTWNGAAYAGIFRTTDGGKSWEEITGDIPIKKQQLLRYNPETKELWSGGPGLFKLKQ